MDIRASALVDMDVPIDAIGLDTFSSYLKLSQCILVQEVVLFSEASNIHNLLDIVGVGRDSVFVRIFARVSRGSVSIGSMGNTARTCSRRFVR